MCVCDILNFEPKIDTTNENDGIPKEIRTTDPAQNRAQNTVTVNFEPKIVKTNENENNRIPKEIKTIDPAQKRAQNTVTEKFEPKIVTTKGHEIDHTFHDHIFEETKDNENKSFISNNFTVILENEKILSELHCNESIRLSRSATPIRVSRSIILVGETDSDVVRDFRRLEPFWFNRLSYLNSGFSDTYQILEELERGENFDRRI